MSVRIPRARRPAFFLACALSIIWASAAPAKTITIDDSGTQALEPSVSLRWKSATPSRSGADNLMIGTTTIRVRINVMPWLRHSGRIYLNLPAQQPGPIARLVDHAGTISAGTGAVRQSRAGLCRPHRDALHGGRADVPFSVDGTLVQRSLSGELSLRNG